ncbi:MAG: alpha-galactosidase, partial [Abditibacteriota bacterium]|nr:alpha-galactosidase [Abditibacteriota bacterium]
MKKVLFILLLSALAAACFAQVKPTESELAHSANLAAAMFGGGKCDIDFEGIVPIRNYGGFEQNARLGKPFKIGETEYKKGFYCHANTDFLVGLPGPAKELSCVIGVDNNNETSGGRGSVTFVFIVNGKEVYTSEVFRGGEPGKKITLPLGGATYFRVKVTDSGDNIYSDQGDVADPYVTLENGGKICVSDMKRVQMPAGYFDTGLPFSFVYGGESSRTLLPKWKRAESAKKLSADVTETTLTYPAPDGFEARCVCKTFADFPAIEWIVYFTNKSGDHSKVLEQVRSLDTAFYHDGSRGTDLHWDRGGVYAANCFEPMVDNLRSGDKHYEPNRGRGTDSVSGYFNFENPGGGGAVVCVGWPGQWAMDCAAREGELAVTAGQKELYGALMPGETVRTPKMLYMPYEEGGFVRAQNLYRRFWFAHVTPKVDGQPPKPCFNMCCDDKTPEAVDRMIKLGCKPDYWWFDAGWYPDCAKGNWFKTGTWRFDTERYPDTFKPTFERAHENGIKTMLWFEPERVHPADAENELFEQHREWLISDAYPDNESRNTNYLLNMGNDKAVDFIIDRFDSIIKEQVIDVYREDFNMHPLDNWQALDTESRKGFVENHHILGHFRLWDTLVERNPGLQIDSCASGGLRDDYDTMTRAIPWLRTDYEINSHHAAHQASFYGSAFWLPIAGIGIYSDDPYGYRSCFAGAATGVWTFRTNHCIDGRPWNYRRLAECVRELRLIQECYAGDFYPLTEWSVSEKEWMAWQFDYPEKDKGLVQIFRREDSPFVSAEFALSGLDKDASYRLYDLDDGDMGT